MTVLRELVARLGFQVDSQGFKQADSAVDKLKAGMQRLGQAAALGGIGVGIKKLVDLASDANETGNVLEQVFGGQGAAQVKDWATTVSAEVGRSQYQLQEFAGRLGAMLGPMVQNKGAAQEMSTTLSKLAVDLGSFFNATDEEALAALRSGISGESEPLKRFGIVLQDATLQEFAHAQGINKKIAAMNVAEKTDLRYQFILANTATAQGDAARTSGSYANSTKALGGALRDLGTEMGQTVMPAIERGLQYVRDGIHAFRDWAKNSQVLKAAMWALGGIAAAVGVSMLAPFVIPAAAVVALILLLDELFNLFSGGKSVIGDYIDTVFGLGAADEYVRNHKAGLDLLAEAWSNLGKQSEADAALANQLSLFEKIEAVGERLYDLYARMGVAIADFFYNLPVIGGAATGKQRTIFSSERAKGRGVEAELMTRQESQAQQLREKAESARIDREIGKPGRASGRGVNAPIEMIRFGQATQSAVGAARTVSAPAAASTEKEPRKSVTVNTGATNLTLNLLGGNIEEMRRAARELLEAERRKTVAAVAKAGAS